MYNVHSISCVLRTVARNQYVIFRRSGTPTRFTYTLVFPPVIFASSARTGMLLPFFLRPVVIKHLSCRIGGPSGTLASNFQTPLGKLPSSNHGIPRKPVPPNLRSTNHTRLKETHEGDKPMNFRRPARNRPECPQGCGIPLPH